ncbi:iron/ascorbate oxidoreductase [Coprinopsis marcescibilis]|uniref:Iron/ascorbate oxidoreductase n=1 Tax=Coprinopsis marcescibilis TaxID=230819 RepID=A0A5C3KK82_COPMA|nr:iron/ascorbate oxidoreductase [Coprinopsis marcescibilis]
MADSTTRNDFTSIPLLDFSLALSQTTKSLFISQLQHALINVGFIYLSNHPVLPHTSRLLPFIPKLFTLTQEQKNKTAMVNSEHFLGYSKLGGELTKGKVDWREQWDFATKHTCRWKKGDPDYFRIWGPCQWPEEELLPGFREALEAYLDAVQDLSYQFSSLVAESLGLGPDGLAKFYDKDEFMQHRAKIVKYPVPPEGGEGQGVGPHYDAGFLTFLLQASEHQGLQVQNLAGEWVDAPPIPGTFVVNIGKALEFVTGGVARATSHRVLSPRGDTPRYSVPFFQNISLTIRLSDEVMQFPPEILNLRDERGDVAATDSVNFTEFNKEPSGKVNLIGRVKSHPDVGERHYPALFKEIFPNGFHGKGSAY